MAKQPAFQFYTGDWLKDPALQACSTATRGIWINLLANMWEANPRGEVSGTIQEIVRLSNTTLALYKRFLDENLRHNFAEVKSSNGVYIIRNRRMFREEKQRIYERERKQKQRSVPLDVPDVSRPCPTPSSSSSSTTVKKEERDRDKKGTDYTQEFESFWKIYPRKIEKHKAFKCWQKLLKEGVKPTHLKVCADNYAGFCDTLKTEPQFIKHPATFLGRDKPYEDYKVSVPVETKPQVPLDKYGNPYYTVDGENILEIQWRKLMDKDAIEPNKDGTWKRRGNHVRSSHSGHRDTSNSDNCHCYCSGPTRVARQTRG